MTTTFLFYFPFIFIAPFFARDLPKNKMLFQTLTVVLSLVGAVTPYPAAGSEKRADTTDLQLYAYGTGISGLQVYGGDDGEKELSVFFYIFFFIFRNWSSFPQENAYH